MTSSRGASLTHTVLLLVSIRRWTQRAAAERMYDARDSWLIENFLHAIRDQMNLFMNCIPTFNNLFPSLIERDYLSPSLCAMIYEGLRDGLLHIIEMKPLIRPGRKDGRR